MHKTEFQHLEHVDKQPTDDLITIKSLSDITDRTLLFGRNHDRSQFHVYIKNGKIHVTTYDVTWFHNDVAPYGVRSIQPKTNKDYLPDNIVYPERSDYEFCKLLIQSGLTVPFAAWVDASFQTAKKHNQFDDSSYFGYTEHKKG